MNAIAATTSSGLFLATIYNQSQLAKESTGHAIGRSTASSSSSGGRRVFGS